MKNDILKHYIEVPDNLFALLSRYRVVIPGIQRHYVQGANNPKAESVRKQFIRASRWSATPDHLMADCKIRSGKGRTF